GFSPAFLIGSLLFGKLYDDFMFAVRLDRHALFRLADLAPIELDRLVLATGHDLHAVERFAEAEFRFIAIPFRRQGRVGMQAVAALSDAEDTLGCHAVEPAGGAGIPGPAALPATRLDGIDVGCDHIGLDAVDIRIAAMADRADEREKLPGFRRPAHAGKRHDRPGRTMGVLAAI